MKVNFKLETKYCFSVEIEFSVLEKCKSSGNKNSKQISFTFHKEAIKTVIKNY